MPGGTKRSYVFKQSTCDFLLPPGTKGLRKNEKTLKYKFKKTKRLNALWKRV